MGGSIRCISPKTVLSFEQISRAEVDEQHLGKLDSIKNDKKFSHTFQQLPTKFEVVEIDKLIACQSTVALEYVEKLIKEFSGSSISTV